MKHLIRRCPMCKEVMGIVIAESVKNILPIHKLCMKCGYGFRWAYHSNVGNLIGIAIHGSHAVLRCKARKVYQEDF